MWKNSKNPENKVSQHQQHIAKVQEFWEDTMSSNTLPNSTATGGQGEVK